MQAYHPDDGGMSMIPHPDMNIDMTWMPPLAVVYEPWTAGSSESDDSMQQQQQGQGLLDGCPYPMQAFHDPDGGAMIPMEEYQRPEMNMNMMMQPPASYPQFDDAPVYMDGYYPMQQVRRNSCYYPSNPVGASSSLMMQGPAGNGNLNNDGGGAQGPAMWMPTDSGNAIAEYPYMHTSGSNPSSAAAAMYPDLFTGDNFLLDMTMPEFPDVDMNYQLGGSYHAQGSSNDARQNSSSVNELLFGHASNN